MTKYFLLTWKHVRGPGVSAFAPQGIPPDHELITSLINSNELPFAFTLVKLTPHRNGLRKSMDLSGLRDIWPDYMPNDQVWPLCSAKLRRAIDSHLIHDEDLHWISAKVSGRGETREYFVARFDTMHDVLDNEKTTYVPGTKHIITPKFSMSGVNELSIFPLPASYDLWRITSSLYVSERLKESIQKECTGVAFE